MSVMVSVILWTGFLTIALYFWLLAICNLISLHQIPSENLPIPFSHVILIFHIFGGLWVLRFAHRVLEVGVIGAVLGASYRMTMRENDEKDEDENAGNIGFL